MTSFSFHVNRLSHSWDKAISNSELETPRSRSWVWSKGKVIQLAQYPINLLPFHFTSIRLTIPDTAILKFDPETPKVKVMSEVKGQVHILYPVSNQCFSFSFHINKFLLIDATALGQGHGKVSQYISPDLYILCSKYLRFSSNGFDKTGKSHCGGSRGGNELKT